MNNKQNPKATDTNIAFNAWLTGLGLTTESFVDEAKKRGLPLRHCTVNKWRMGVKPRPFITDMLKKKFKTIHF